MLFSHGAIMPDTPSYTLPTTVYPERYQIRLTPDLAACTFAGEETVLLTVCEPVREIVLNTCELAIHTVAVTPADGHTVQGTAALDEPNERTILRFPQTLSPGPWQLHLTFSGILNDKLHGFYRSMYTDANGQKKVLACTQF